MSPTMTAAKKNLAKKRLTVNDERVPSGGAGRNKSRGTNHSGLATRNKGVFDYGKSSTPVGARTQNISTANIHKTNPAQMSTQELKIADRIETTSV